jgi:hypothetical protein
VADVSTKRLAPVTLEGEPLCHFAAARTSSCGRLSGWPEATETCFGASPAAHSRQTAVERDVWRQTRRENLRCTGETRHNEEEAMGPRNREQRGHPERLERPEDQDARGPVEADTGTPRPMPDDELRKPGRQQDVPSVGAENSGHGKKTGDKSNP